jgi:hypothetical protein
MEAFKAFVITNSKGEGICNLLKWMLRDAADCTKV